MPQSLLIVGASARAAAHSACFAGLRPAAIDLFADTDLAACGSTCRVSEYPRGLVTAARTFAASPWMYTGALENHPDVLEQLQQDRCLLGNPAAAVRPVRDPWTLASALREQGFLYPHVRRIGEPAPDADGLWKPLRSAGGTGVRRENVSERLEDLADTHYWQERISGGSLAAVFVGACQHARLLGATRQLVGRRWAGAVGYQYTGSVGPLALEPSLRQELDRLGNALASRFGLVGLFGVDGIVNSRGFWTIEVNPRYTASVEILERSFNAPAIAYHLAACHDGVLPEPLPAGTRVIWGKAIVYALHHVTIPAAFTDLAKHLNTTRRWPLVADIPAPGTEVESGRPITTVFAEGRSCEEVEAELCARAWEVQRLVQS
jgi:predicted ATP-grasp superfamily ATP-dependent carboligase